MGEWLKPWVAKPAKGVIPSEGSNPLSPPFKKCLKSIPAVITPFINNEVDYDSLLKVLNFLIDNGSDGLVPCGTTGESPTLSHEEHKKIIEETIRIADKRVPVIAGTGSNNTLEAAEYTAHAEKSGADAALIVTLIIINQLNLDYMSTLKQLQIKLIFQ